MRKEQKRKLFLVTMLVAILFAVDLWLVYGPENRPESENEIVVYRMDPQQVAAIRYLSEDGEVALVKREGLWTWEADGTFPLNQNFAENMLKKAAVLTVSRMIGEGEAALRSYGLEHPSNIIRLTAGTSEKTIFLGDTNSATGECYLMVEGSKKVYLADPSFAKLFSTGLYEMASRETLPGIALENIRELTVLEENKVFIVRRQEQADGGAGSWEVRQEVLGGGNAGAQQKGPEDLAEAWQEADETLVSRLLSRLIALRYEKMVLHHPEKSQMTAYGLEQPELVLRLRYEEDGEEREYVLSVGGLEEESRRYVYAESGQGIYVAGNASLESFFHLEPEDFLTLNLASVKAEELQKLVIATSRQRAEFEILRGEDGKNTYLCNGKDMTEREFNSVYYPLYVFSAEKRVSDMAGQLEEEPVLSLNYECLPGRRENLEVELIPYDQNYYAARINGSARLLVNRQKVNGLLDALKAYLQEK